MKRYFKILSIALVAIAVLAVGPATKRAAAQTQLTIYMQMGGNQGDPSTLARTNGAEAAAKALGIKLVEQYSGWDPNTMIDQFKQAEAASPDGIVIMGHPGEDAFTPLVDDAEGKGIVITSGNNPLPTLEAKYAGKGFGYAGADLHAGGYLTGQAMISQGKLKSGDEAVVYDIWHNKSRSLSSQGIVDALKDGGIKVDDPLDVSDAVDKDASQGIPVLTAYIAAHPNLKAIGTQHGNVTAIMEKVLQAAGKKPGDIAVGGIDLSPATVQGIQDGFITVSFDQELYLQGYLPVQQIYFTKMFQIPGLHVNTGVGIVSADNIKDISALIQKGLR